VRCGKVGDVSGLFDANPDGRTGTGAGSGKNARHFELMVLPHQQYVAKK
jgi:hypothetical protein